MAQIKTITVNQLAWLKWARNRAHDWRGNHNPDYYDNFDAQINLIDEALKQATHDRLTLRAAVDYIRNSPCDPDITSKQFKAYRKLIKLMPGVDL